MSTMKCPFCKSPRVNRAGYRATVSEGRKPRLQCLMCGKTFYPAAMAACEGGGSSKRKSRRGSKR